MAGGPSPSSAAPNGAATASFLPPFPSSSSSSSPPQPSFADAFGPAGGVAAHGYALAPIGVDRKSLGDKNGSLRSGFAIPEHAAGHADALEPPPPTVLLRRLPRSTTIETLRSMLLFAKDLIDVDFVSADIPEDHGFVAAIARFKTLNGANEAKERLHGKANTSNDASMVVEVLQHGVPGYYTGRRNTVDSSLARHRSISSQSMSPPNGLANRQPSRFNDTFQSLEKMSPPNGVQGLKSDAFPVPEPSSRISNLFSPQSPIGPSFMSSKSMINVEDEETGRLLKDPVAYAKSGENHHALPSRHLPNPQIPLSRFAGMSLNTADNVGNVNRASREPSPPMSSFASPRMAMQSPNGVLSPTSLQSPMSAMSNVAPYHMNPKPYQRHNYPPVNPADQNPPCNTLYVGNLPIDTSEDELKAMFSKQRGYKRLCFRTKQNGPMCFVEFEDVSFATKALNELYGHPLHNSVKGGIRLSFSKNPLGVRSAQNNNANIPPATPHTPQGIHASHIGAPPGFPAAGGPPPGLAAPPGLTGPIGNPSAGGFGAFGAPMGGPMRQPIPGGGVGANGFHAMGNDYSAYMMGR